MSTIVLVHGTTAGGWVWKAVIPPLQAAGHTVYTPTLTGLGERSHLLTRQVGLETHLTDVVNQGPTFQRAMARSWQRAQARGWALREVDTVHQILPDPEPKATILLELAEG